MIVEWAREDPEAVLARVEVCALALYEKLQHLQFDLADRIHVEVAYCPEDWPLLESPFWEDYGWRQPFISFRVVVGIEDQMWIVLQWLTLPGSHIGHFFYPMIAARSAKSGKWTHSRKYGHGIELTPEQVALVRAVDAIVDGQIAVVLRHFDNRETTTLGAQVFAETNLSPVGWTEDVTWNIVNIGVLCCGQPVEQFDRLFEHATE